MTAKVLMYATATCPFCQSAERLLVSKGVRIDKIRVDLEPERWSELARGCGRLAWLVTPAVIDALRRRKPD